MNSCKHAIINNTAAKTIDTVVVVTPPSSGSGTSGSGGSTTSSDTVCFNADILPLYTSYCGSTGCHDATTHKDGKILTDYTHIMNGIKAKFPASSTYYTIIGNGMPPKSSPQLSSTQKDIIYKWINQGALNTSCTNPCDTNTFTYSGSIQTIIANNCAGCHGTSPGSGNIYLGTTYTTLKTYVSANKALFNNAITYSSSLTAVQKMPPSGQMASCKITQIQKWIANGYPQ
jgi:hypothetical protein